MTQTLNNKDLNNQKREIIKEGEGVKEKNI